VNSVLDNGHLSDGRKRWLIQFFVREKGRDTSVIDNSWAAAEPRA